MRQLVSLLALAWAGANLYVAYLFVSSGLRLVKKGVLQQALLVSGGLLIAVFALVLVVAAVTLFLSREAQGRSLSPAR